MKAGDQVICKDVSGFDMRHLTEGETYTVEWTYGADVKLVGVEYSTKQWRFAAAPTQQGERSDG